MEAQTIARACGKSHVLNLEPEDLCAVTLEAAAMAQVPLAGTDWYPGKPGTELIRKPPQSTTAKPISTRSPS